MMSSSLVGLMSWSRPLILVILLLGPGSAWSGTDLEARSMIKSLHMLANLVEVDLDTGSTSEGLLDELDQIQDRIQHECDDTDQRYNTDLQQSITQQQEYQHEIQTIQDHIQQLQNQSQTEQDQIGSSQQAQRQLQDRVVPAQDRISQLGADLDRSTSTWKKQSDALNNVIAVDTKAIGVITDLIELIKKPTSDIDPSLTQLITLLSTSDSDDIRARLAKIQADLDKYRTQGQKERQDTRTRLLNNVRLLLKDVQKNLSTAQALITDNDKRYQDEQDSIKSKIESEQSRLADLQEQIKQISDQIAETEAEVDQISEQIAELQSSLSEFEPELQQINEHIQDTNEALSEQQMTCIEYRRQLQAVRRFLQSHPPNALESACKPGEPQCPLCLVDENCPEGLQCSKYAICYNSSISKHGLW